MAVYLIEFILKGLALVNALLDHFSSATVTLTTKDSGQWFATVTGDITNKGHDTVGAVSSIINYGAVLLAQLLAAFEYGNYNGPYSG